MVITPKGGQQYLPNLVSCGTNVDQPTDRSVSRIVGTAMCHDYYRKIHPEQ
jgi:hypothetical protein